MTAPQNSPEQELNAITALTSMNPHILRVGIVIADLTIGTPFIIQQIAEITGIHPTPVSRNVRALDRGGMVEQLSRSEQNGRLRPYARVSHPRWRFFQGVRRQAGIGSLTDLFERDWNDIEGWLRQSGGSTRRTKAQR